uniref:Uncharacterized protein n=1 Tax=Panagrolaimus superbus TaxID=310955 RepID=A0A914Y967_9BILA
MKLLLLFGICLILCFQISHQFPSGTKEVKAPFRKDDEISVNTFSELQNKRLGKYWKTHGIRSVGESEDGIGNGVKIDSNTNADAKETELSKRGLIKKVYKKMDEKVKDPRNYVPILLKRNVKDELTDNNETPLVGVPSDFDLGSGVITDKDNIKPGK